MKTVAPKYIPDAPEGDLEPPKEIPELLACVSSDNCLLLPSALRMEFLQCPLRGPDWRQFLKRFDADHAAPVAMDVVASSEPQTPQEPTQWEKIFPGEISQDSGLAEPDTTWPVDGAPCIMKKIGQKLFVSATADCELEAGSGILQHGQGNWLIDQKAATFLQDLRTFLVSESGEMV